MSATGIALVKDPAAQAETPRDSHHEIEALAYFLWQELGAPLDGSSESDWIEAERLLRMRTG